ncbi:holo-ACP synthase [Mumia sp. zg.B17]|uniref:holo-ACP synthase n=1 Tax=Mumia sp. zg.B17 TaxID=2855446 RepID=UPI001C6E4122|nr:holo-ACP synthase [Mumia sp. zg.B17]MBW9204725.1 holo-ACP synthase [Mumia sp. zg.B17]
MIVGIGVDVVDVERFAAALEQTPALRERLFAPAERTGAPVVLAGRFAAKEALAKALGSPGGLSWHDAEVGRSASGRPTLTVTGAAGARAAELGVVRWHLSIAHDGPVATAFVVGEG